MEALKPCPFCGGEAELYSGGIKYALCKECLATSGDFKTEAEAVEAWNTRYEEIGELEPLIGGYKRCKRCGAFVRADAVTDCCGVIPIRHCPNCGIKVVE